MASYYPVTQAHNIYHDPEALHDSALTDLTLFFVLSSHLTSNMPVFSHVLERPCYLLALYSVMASMSRFSWGPHQLSTICLYVVLHCLKWGMYSEKYVVRWFHH